MSFKEDFKALLEELVIPEIHTIKSQIGEIRTEMGSARASILGDIRSLRDDVKASHRSQNEKMDLTLELIQELSEKVKTLTNSLRD